MQKQHNEVYWVVTDGSNFLFLDPIVSLMQTQNSTAFGLTDELFKAKAFTEGQADEIVKSASKALRMDETGISDVEESFALKKHKVNFSLVLGKLN